jgi:D-alanine-D-alanine ligase
MKIGITYDLKDDYLKMGYGPEQAGEFDKIETIDAIDQSLQQLGFSTEKIGHNKNLMAALMAGKRWDLVFNYTEGLFGMSREAFGAAILEAYEIPIVFSDSLTLALCLHKGMTKTILRHLGVPTADFWVIKNLNELKNFHVNFPLFVKPVAEGMGKGIDLRSIVNSNQELYNTCQKTLTAFNQPVLIETFLPGREFTVGITGTDKDTKAIGTLEIIFTDHSLGHIHSYQNKAECEKRVQYLLLKDDLRLKQEIEQIAVDAWKGLNCRDGGRIDIRLDKQGKPMFMEVNPLPGLDPVISDLTILCQQEGISYLQLIKSIMNSALKRYGSIK